MSEQIFKSALEAAQSVLPDLKWHEANSDGTKAVAFLMSGLDFVKIEGVDGDEPCVVEGFILGSIHAALYLSLDADGYAFSFLSDHRPLKLSPIGVEIVGSPAETPADAFEAFKLVATHTNPDTHPPFCPAPQMLSAEGKVVADALAFMWGTLYNADEAPEKDVLELPAINELSNVIEILPQFNWLVRESGVTIQWGSPAFKPRIGSEDIAKVYILFSHTVPPDFKKYPLALSDLRVRAQVVIVEGNETINAFDVAFNLTGHGDDAKQAWADLLHRNVAVFSASRSMFFPGSDESVLTNSQFKAMRPLWELYVSKKILAARIGDQSENNNIGFSFDEIAKPSLTYDGDTLLRECRDLQDESAKIWPGLYWETGRRNFIQAPLSGDARLGLGMMLQVEYIVETVPRKTGIDPTDYHTHKIKIGVTQSGVPLLKIEASGVGLAEAWATFKKDHDCGLVRGVKMGLDGGVTVINRNVNAYVPAQNTVLPNVDQHFGFLWGDIKKPANNVAPVLVINGAVVYMANTLYDDSAYAQEKASAEQWLSAQVGDVSESEACDADAMHAALAEGTDQGLLLIHGMLADVLAGQRYLANQQAQTQQSVEDLRNVLAVVQSDVREMYSVVECIHENVQGLYEDEDEGGEDETMVSRVEKLICMYHEYRSQHGHERDASGHRILRGVGPDGKEISITELEIVEAFIETLEDTNQTEAVISLVENQLPFVRHVFNVDIYQRLITSKTGIEFLSALGDGIEDFLIRNPDTNDEKTDTAAEDNIEGNRGWIKTALENPSRPFTNQSLKTVREALETLQLVKSVLPIVEQLFKKELKGFNFINAVRLVSRTVYGNDAQGVLSLQELFRIIFIDLASEPPGEKITEILDEVHAAKSVSDILDSLLKYAHFIDQKDAEEGVTPGVQETVLNKLLNVAKSAAKPGAESAQPGSPLMSWITGLGGAKAEAGSDAPLPDFESLVAQIQSGVNSVGDGVQTGENPAPGFDIGTILSSFLAGGHGGADSNDIMAKVQPFFAITEKFESGQMDVKSLVDMIGQMVPEFKVSPEMALMMESIFSDPGATDNLNEAEMLRKLASVSGFEVQGDSVEEMLANLANSDQSTSTALSSAQALIDGLNQGIETLTKKPKIRRR